MPRPAAIQLGDGPCAVCACAYELAPRTRTIMIRPLAYLGTVHLQMPHAYSTAGSQLWLCQLCVACILPAFRKAVLRSEISQQLLLPAAACLLLLHRRPLSGGLGGSQCGSQPVEALRLGPEPRCGRCSVRPSLLTRPAGARHMAVYRPAWPVSPHPASCRSKPAHRWTPRRLRARAVALAGSCRSWTAWSRGTTPRCASTSVAATASIIPRGAGPATQPRRPAPPPPPTPSGSVPTSHCRR
jgi:hypothetical protein